MRGQEFSNAYRAGPHVYGGESGWVVRAGKKVLNSFRSRVIGAGWTIRSKGGINGVEVGHKFGAVAGTELGKAGSVVFRKCNF